MLFLNISQGFRHTHFEKQVSVTLLTALWAFDQKHKGSIRFTVDLANTISQDRWI